ncbi:hypothetical protein Syun_012302 [Stephania yunnanensis]|uniref:Uncharacterized protein n=1 Tax=Stephania yunnanensis TaxID=152371 RepID=A0AAP0JZB2_9MAGN
MVERDATGDAAGDREGSAGMMTGTKQTARKSTGGKRQRGSSGDEDGEEVGTGDGRSEEAAQVQARMQEK